jgi:hypothetical protein
MPCGPSRGGDIQDVKTISLGIKVGGGREGRNAKAQRRRDAKTRKPGRREMRRRRGERKGDHKGEATK